MPHRKHTITKLEVSRERFEEILCEEHEAGRTIHAPTQIYSPQTGEYHWHWQFRGHERQLRYDQVLVLSQWV